MSEVRGVRVDLNYLISTFPPGTRSRLLAYCVMQFLISFMDLVGVAAVLPVMQVLSGSSMTDGYIGTIHDILGAPDRQAFVVELCGLMVLAFALKALGAILISWWSAGLVAHLQVGTATRLLDNFLRESYLHQLRREVGEVIRTVGASVNSAHTLVLGGVLSIFGQLLSIFFIAILLAFVAPWVTLVAVIYLGCVVALVQLVLSRRNRTFGKTAQRAAFLMSRAMLQAIHGAREVRMHDARKHFVQIYRDAAETNAEAARRANFYGQTPKYVLEFTTILGLAILLSATTFTGSASNLLPVLAVFVAAAVKLLPVVTAFSVTIGNIRYGQDGLALTVDALRIAGPDEVGPEEDNGAGGARVEVGPASAELAVQDLRFRYPGGVRDVLEDVSFRVPHGASLAVCGTSGSGKTTLINIVLGLIPPTAGSVRYGSMDVLDGGRRWRDQVAYVPQDVYTLAAPLWANVAFGVAEADVDKERVARCIAEAELGDLFESLNGVDTMLGTAAGVQLSGGQRQRVGIARALYRDSQVMVFDEATSALDNETEDKVGKVIRNLHGKVTTILVAHRLSSIRHVDTILYLDEGRIADAGSFGDLRRSSDAFERLVRLGSLD